jgi:phosphatidylserine/phosphatidylglycerophosphate/cardiolipin synthase-like enzyme
LRALFEALNTAKHFVHFTTYGISHSIIGALKMASQRVAVRGIVSNVDASALAELCGYPDEAPRFQIKTYGTQASWAEMPHQKLVVIDGLFAFKGSANLTLNAWRKSAKGRDLVEIVTDVDEVIALHNRFFAPLWGELSTIGESVNMYDRINIPW